MMYHALVLIVLQLISVPVTVAKSNGWALVDESGHNMVGFSTGGQGGKTDEGPTIHVHLQVDGEVLEKNLHRSPGVFSDEAVIKVLQNGEIVKQVVAGSIDALTYTADDGSAVFSMVGEDEDPEMDGIVLGSSGVLHVHAKAGAQLEVSNDGAVLGVCGGIDSQEDHVHHGGHVRRLLVERWTDCYDGDSTTQTFSIGAAIGSGLFQRKFSNNHEAAVKWLNSVVAEANVIYKPQLNIVLTVGEVIIQQGSQGAPTWDDPNCQLGLSNQLSNFRKWQQPSKQGLWHLFDDCFGASGSSIGLATMLVADPPGTLCMMDPVPGYNEFWNTAVSWYGGSTWKTFAHEVGHNFGGHHSFEDGQGDTGGIMDYGDGKLHGEYQFNTKYRKDEICKSIQKVVGSCSAFAVFNAGTTITTSKDSSGTSGTTSTTTVVSTTVAINCDSSCQDKLGVSSTMTVNQVKYTDCASLIAATNQFGSGFWCSNYESQFKVCQKSCGACGLPAHCGESTTAAPTSTTTLTTTATTTIITTTTTVTTTATTATSSGILSGATVFLRTLSGNGNHMDVEGISVQARWESQGNWQAMTIEKENGGSVNSGDTVYLKAHTGLNIDIAGEAVQARWNAMGTWQAVIIEKQTGSGAVQPDDVVCFKAWTGKYLDVEDNVVRARWNECGDWQKMRIETEVFGAVFSGNSINLAAHTGKFVEVEGEAVQARWSERGEWQTFVIESYGGRVIFSGDAVFLKAHTGNFVDVQGVAVQARWNDKGTWQRLLIERKDGAGPVMPGDTVFLWAHTEMIIDVDGVAVQARWSDHGTWQSLVIEKANSRRLADTTDPGDESASGALLGIVLGILGAAVLLVAMIMLMWRSRLGKTAQWDCSYKVQPKDEDDAHAVEGH